MRSSPVSNMILLACGLAAGMSAACRESDPRVIQESGADGSPGAGASAAEFRGDSLYGRGDIEDAQSAFEAALLEARASGDSLAESRLLTSLGLAAWRLGDFPAARRLGEEALSLKQRLELEPLLFRSLNALGLLAWSESRYHDAADLYESAFETARATADTTNLAKVSNNFALYLLDIGEFAAAREYFVWALDAARALGDSLIEGRVLTDLGALEHQVGNPRAAIRHLEEARRLYAGVGDVVGDQNALGQLGTAYATMGFTGQALAYLDSALAQAREHGLRQDEASDLELLAGVYRETGDLPRALRLLGEASDLSAELGLGFEQGAALRQAARIHARLGAYDAAMRTAEEALALHRRLEAGREELSDLLLLADLAEEAALTARATEYLATAGVLAEQYDVRAARVEVALVRASVAERRENWEGVLAALDDVAADLDESGYLREWESSTRRARALARSGAIQDAIYAGRRAIRAAERVRSTLASSALRTSFLAEKQATYFDLTGTLLAVDRVDEAFEVADGARGRALLEHLVAAASQEGGEGRRTVQSLVQGELFLRQIDTLIARMDDLEEYRDAGWEALHAELRSDLDQKRSEYEAIITRAADIDSQGVTLLGAGRVSPSQVVGALESDEALLQYLVGPDRIIIFLATSAGVRQLTAESPRGSLVGRIRLVRDLLSRPFRTGADAAEGHPWMQAGPESVALQGLYDLLIGPVVEDGGLDGIRRLIIVPHAELSYVPFAALIDPATRRYLGQDFELLHLPSSSALPTLRNRAADGRTTDASRPMAFAPFPDQLPATSVEVAAFERSRPGARVARGRRATEAGFRQALATRAVVHAATHGVLNPRNPMFSRVELAPGSSADHTDDGRFELHELLGLSVASSLVFLSGCETGLGTAWSTDFAQGEDYATLAQAFLYAGAANVVATLWRIEDEGAAAFAEHFYRELQTASPAAALAAAKRAMMADPRFRAPFYWAGYRLSGNGQL